MQDPNLAVMPDFTSDEHLEACTQLVNDGFTDDQAARSLASLWAIANNTAKAKWAESLERREANRLRAEEEAQQRQQALEDEEEATRREDRKKPLAEKTGRRTKTSMHRCAGLTYLPIQSFSCPHTPLASSMLVNSANYSTSPTRA